MGAVTLESLMVESAEGVRPPERLTVAEAAVKYRKLNNPGSYVGDWTNEMTPYLVQPQEVLTSRDYTAMVFVGPAQCGKTDMVLNWQTYGVVCDPADMMIIQTAQDVGRDFSIRRIDRLHRHSPEVGTRLLQRRDADNTFDKKYKSGMLLTIAWPTINQLSGRPVPRLWLTDYDRMVDDVDGEGSPFDLARKRATTFKSFGMTVAESSPGRVVTDPKWQRRTPHEAPRTTGILSLYNRGDRRLWYWKCISCELPFEPDFKLLHYPDSADEVEAAEAAVMVCPHCGQVYSHEHGKDTGPGKHAMNQLYENGGRSKWVMDGQRWAEDGSVVGDPFRSDIASFWLKGAAAAFSDWKGLVLNFIKAEQEYEDTGSETSLKTTVNVDQGLPYVPKADANQRLPEALKARAKPYGDKMVPLGGRFLIASIDVQKNRFVVQVHAIGEGLDVWVVDRYEIKKSRRVDEDGDPLWVNPGAYGEDWKLVVSEVMSKSYPLNDGSGRMMPIMQTICDSGGREGVTEKAYEFVRWLRRDPNDEVEDALYDDVEWTPELAGRFMLLKGASSPTAPRLTISYPDSQRKDRHAGARGEIPVALINTNTLKDALDKRLDRTEARGGRINFPDWLDNNFYAELCVEIKDPKKGWTNPRKFRNESWDLLTYCLAAFLLPTVMAEHIDWADPPGWAKAWDENDLVYDPTVKNKPFENDESPDYDLSDLAEILA